MLVLTCASGVDQATGQCLGAMVWVEIPSEPQAAWVDYLPTVQQANEVGAAFFVGYVILAAMRDLLFPSDSE